MDSPSMLVKINENMRRTCFVAKVKCNGYTIEQAFSRQGN